MSARRRHNGVQKICQCGRSRWPKCQHTWYIRFKPRGGQRWQLSLDAELRRHISSRTEAENEAAKIRAAILAGTFCRATEAAPKQASGDLTLDQFAPIYIERCSKASGKRSWKDDQHRLSKLREHRAGTGSRLGDLPLSSITEDELEVFHVALLTSGLAASTRNHYVQLLKAMFRWATKKSYLARNPISEDSTLKRSKVAQRARRLSAGEEAALLKAAGALDQRVGFRLSGLIVAALETGARRGELLGLQWDDVNLERRELLIRAENTKDAEVRRLPISSRLTAVLEMAQTDPAGRTHPPASFVFGDALGRRVRSVKKARETCVLRAHTHEPKWTSGGKLSQESRLTLRAVDLHFHDLRREAGSRWLDAGMPLHHVRELLGHANISQTDTYLTAGRIALHESIQRFDAARGEGPAVASPTPRGNPVVNRSEIERRPLNHAVREKPSKGLLH